jgi:hypothetical protein
VEKSQFVGQKILSSSRIFVAQEIKNPRLSEEREGMGHCENVRVEAAGIDSPELSTGKSHISDSGDVESNVTDAIHSLPKPDPDLADLLPVPYLPSAAGDSFSACDFGALK